MQEYSPKWCSFQRKNNTSYPLDLLIDRCKLNLTDPAAESLTRIRVDITGFSTTVVEKALEFFHNRGWSVEIKERGGINYLEFADWCTYIDMAMKAYDSGQFAVGAKMLEIAAKQLETSVFTNEVKNMAVFYYQRHKKTRAEKVLRRALTAYSRIPEKADQHVANIMLNLGELYLSSEKDDRAAASYENYVALMEQIAGPEAEILERSLTKLSHIYCRLGDSNKAQAYYLRALKLRNQLQPTIDFAVPKENRVDLSAIVVAPSIPSAAPEDELADIVTAPSTPSPSSV